MDAAGDHRRVQHELVELPGRRPDEPPERLVGGQDLAPTAQREARRGQVGGQGVGRAVQPPQERVRIHRPHREAPGSPPRGRVIGRHAGPVRLVREIGDEGFGIGDPGAQREGDGRGRPPSACAARLRERIVPEPSAR